MAASSRSSEPDQFGSAGSGQGASEQAASERWRRVKTIFLEAVDRPDAERRAFIEAACGGDADLRQEIASLLESDQSAGSFCETPAAGLLGAGAFRGLAAEVRLQAGTQIAGYEITGFVGAGGMGEVYRA